MKLVWVGIFLLLATVGIGVGCGPKEKYCFQEMDTCRNVENAILADAMWEATPDADASSSGGPCFDNNGVQIPCVDR
jgi:hypothetical protein